MAIKKSHWLLLLILGIATLLRLYHVAAISLWHDEAFSALLINYPFKEMIYRIGLDVHPPAYYIALRLWADVFGHSLFALRGFSVFFGVLTVWATYLFVKSAFRRTDLALAASLLMAVNPFQIQYVTEARMYTFGAFAIMISAYFLIEGFNWQRRYDEFCQKHTYLKEAMRSPENIAEWSSMVNHLWLNWLFFAIATSIALYTHYYLFFSAFAIGLYGLYHLFKNYGLKFWQFRYFVAAYIIVAISYVPWLKTFLFQFRQVQNNYWIPKMDRWSIPLTNYRMLLGTGADAAKRGTDVLLVLAMIFSLYLVYRIIKKEESQHKWLVVLGLLVPFFGAILMSLKQSIFLDRYFLFAALFYTVALAIMIYRAPRTWAVYALLLLFTAVGVINWAKNWSDLRIESKPGMSGAAAYLNSYVGPKDYLYVGSSFEYFNFKYYNNTGRPALLYTPGIKKVTDLPHYSGTAILTDADLIHDFNAQAKHGDTVWLLWTSAFGGSEPSVPAKWIKLSQNHYEDVRPYSGTQIYVDRFLVQ